MKNNFKIKGNKIVFEPVTEGATIDILSDARDWGEKMYFEEIRQGKLLIFDEWDIFEGYIKFHVK